MVVAPASTGTEIVAGSCAGAQVGQGGEGEAGILSNA